MVRRATTFHMVWSYCFCAALVVATVWLVTRAAAGGPKQGAYVGLAVIAGAAALGSTTLLVAIQRKRRRG